MRLAWPYAALLARLVSALEKPREVVPDRSVEAAECIARGLGEVAAALRELKAAEKPVVPLHECPECGCVDLVPFGKVVGVGEDGSIRETGVTGRCARCLVELVASTSIRTAPRPKSLGNLGEEQQKKEREEAYKRRVVG